MVMKVIKNHNRYYNSVHELIHYAHVCISVFLKERKRTNSNDDCTPVKPVEGVGRRGGGFLVTGESPMVMIS